MHIASLATHLDLIDTIARWHQEQWREAPFRAEQVLCRANRDRTMSHSTEPSSTALRSSSPVT